MQESADSAPFSAWLWNLQLTMLSTKAWLFSGSAWSRLDLNFPVTETACGCELSLASGGAYCHASSPQMQSGPAYGHWETPLVPKKRSVTSHQPLTNCVELNVTSTPPEY